MHRLYTYMESLHPETMTLVAGQYSIDTLVNQAILNQ
jgi:hypothetical protein